jgi:hypothetical protein
MIERFMVSEFSIAIIGYYNLTPVPELGLPRIDYD